MEPSFSRGMPAAGFDDTATPANFRRDHGETTYTYLSGASTVRRMESRANHGKAVAPVSNILVTQHAIDRYIQRVEPSASRDDAHDRVARIVTLGQARPTPRHWMRERVRLTPGIRFVYWWQQPQVCALVLNGAVITILTRALCAMPAFASAGAAPDSLLPTLGLMGDCISGPIFGQHEYQEAA